MEQLTHAWIAIRALALLEETNSCPRLVDLLRPCARHAAIGAWIPDLTDIKRGGAGTMHHVLKMMPLKGEDERFVAKKDKLVKRLTCSQAARDYLTNTAAPDKEWWSKPYKADPAPGQHIANRAMGHGSVLKDLLLLGSPDIDEALPGKVKFIDSVDFNARTRREEAALHFFMLSHFLADACMPCHCDGRPLMGYDEGLHKELEHHWREGVAGEFGADDVTVGAATEKGVDSLFRKARKVDGVFGLQFPTKKVEKLPSGRDVWLETIDVCRVSFALAALIAPPDQFSYGSSTARAPFSKVLEGQELLADIDRVVLTDAVVNTATVWAHLWDKAAKVEE